LKRLLVLDKILYAGECIECYLEYIQFKLVTSTFPKWMPVKHLRWIQLLYRLVDLNKMLYGGIEYYLDCTLFNPVASTVPKSLSLKLLRWAQLLNRFVDWIKFLCCDRVEYYLDYILFNPVASSVPK
jgi:hypothetical protein